MSNILGLKFSDYGQIYYFESGAFVVKKGDRVIVKTEQGMGLGTVVTVSEELPEGVETEELKPIFRLASEEDLATQEGNLEFARDAFEFCRRCIIERKLEMKLVDVEVFFDRGKMVFFFTAPGRIDFRELVKDLVKNYRTRIELRQIGVRHETQMLGAVGNCGQVACCRRFLRKFNPVTIKMAKEQNLFLNPTKISGICGRLLCCLSFEEENYHSFYKRCPKIGKRMDTDQGLMKVLRANFFRSSVTVFSEHGEELELTLDEWEELNPRRFDPNAPRPEPAPQPRPKRGPRQNGGKRPPRQGDRGDAKGEGAGGASGKGGDADSRGRGSGKGGHKDSRRRDDRGKGDAQAQDGGPKAADDAKSAPKGDGKGAPRDDGKPRRKPRRRKRKRKPRGGKPGGQSGKPGGQGGKSGGGQSGSRGGESGGSGGE